MSPGRSGRPASWTTGFPPPSVPLPVTGGLVARSVRGEIGEHWWSRRFVEVLESFALGTRLSRGKNYARRGQVMSLEIGPGAVTAKVQGSRLTPYRVRIGLAPFSELVWAKVEVALAEQAIYSARLLAGEMPLDLEQVFAAAGAPLFPVTARQLAMSCSCPDSEVPCKHISATCYLLAEQFDTDPFQILHWRGRPKPALLSRLRDLRDVAPDVASGDLDAAAEEDPLPRLLTGSAAALAGVGPPSSEAGLAAFWTAGTVPRAATHAALPGDLLLRQLPVPESSLGGAGLLRYLRPLYLSLAESD